MLFVQDICLSYGKKDRLSVYAEERAKFPMVDSLDKLPDTLHGEVIVHRLNFRQRENKFQASYLNDKNRLQLHTSVRNLNLANLSICRDAKSYEVTFFRDERRSGQPIRRGHNKDYHNLDSLLYMTNNPDFEYKQTAVLY